VNRVVEREWLDELPADDPRARQSRHDIQRINLLSGHDRIIARALAEAFDDDAPENIVDLGAGNGRLLLSVVRRLSKRWKNVSVTLVDRVNGFDPQIREEFSKLGWRAEIEVVDALTWLRSMEEKKGGAVVANHFFHQIEDADLAEAFQLLESSARTVIAAEPRRGPWPLLCSKLVWLVGSAPVTRYDAPISVRAGFRGRELSALWPDKTNSQLVERPAGWFSHLFVARKKSGLS
jgi:hypothetical protein